MWIDSIEHSTAQYGILNLHLQFTCSHVWDSKFTLVRKSKAIITQFYNVNANSYVLY